jgi:membrane-bound lytic murein transglycosylase B
VAREELAARELPVVEVQAADALELRVRLEVSLLRLDAKGGYEYWLGLNNFYVITRYNHSTHYAMAVYQLGQAVRARRGAAMAAVYTPDGARLSLR